MDWSMGGYGFYVWGSYLCALITIGLEIFFVTRRKGSRASSREEDRSNTSGLRGSQWDSVGTTPR